VAIKSSKHEAEVLEVRGRSPRITRQKTSTSSTPSLKEHSYSNGDTLTPEATPEASGNSLAFGKFVLGKATQVKSKTSSPSVFVLRQNYLFEFEEWDNLNSRPRGLAFCRILWYASLMMSYSWSIMNDQTKVEAK